MSAIDDKYAALGGAGGFLGAPTTAERKAPDGIGRYRHYAGGSIYWHPFTGAHEVHGLIRTKWSNLGWERSPLGYPKTDERKTSAGGSYNLFQGGTILWRSGAKEAFETHGAIRSAHGRHGFEKGFLGFPTTDETATPDGVGRYNHFEGGSIYWKPSIGAHEVHGLIRKRWSELQWERGPLGYPIADERPVASGSKDRYSDFENGVLLWTHGSSAATVVPRFVFGDQASRSAAEVLAAITDLVVPVMTSDPRVYVKSGPKIAAVTDYTFDGSSVHNRRYKIRTDVGVDISGTADPTSNLDLWIGIDYQPSTREVIGRLTGWHVHTHVPWPTSIGLSADEVNERFHAALDPQMHVPQVLATVPEALRVLAVKVMPNGDLDIFKAV